MKTEDIVRHLSEISGLAETEISKHNAIHLEHTPEKTTISTEEEVLWEDENHNESYQKTREFLGGMLSETLHYRRVGITLVSKEYPTVSLDILVTPQ
ncbi:hypothetical protein NVP1103O_63 [Vibrio phage 1.103.O._10N.261.52.F2]|nr:hypothetical protein NVP1103O_63 [Vibrio phage 1.103.O._10N.261.52.F2]